VLVFEVVSIDPGATVMSPRAAAVPVASRPTLIPPPPPTEYAGSIPAGPVSEPLVTKGPNMTAILIGAGTLAFLCLCGAFFWWVDATFRWCVFFPFISGC